MASLTATVRYCERGASPEFWAEPVNVLTNAGFLVAAALGWRLLCRTPLLPADRTPLTALVVIAATIGFGSAAFHTMPTAVTKLADVIPIAVFVAAALFLALTKVFGVSRHRAVLWLSLLAMTAGGIAAAGSSLGCGDGTCLNGAPAYLPVLAALAATASAAHRQGSSSFVAFTAATAVFALALTARTLDHAACPLASVATVSVTAHAFWHLGTALTVYLVLRGLTAGLGVRATS